MSKQSEQVAHAELVGSAETSLHSHAGGGGGYTEGARVRSNSDIEMPDGENILLAFDSELWDTDNIHSNTQNPSRLTCKTAGKYYISAAIFWEFLSGGVYTLFIILNGEYTICGEMRNIPAPLMAALTFVTIWDLAVNDYVEVMAIQISGNDAMILNNPFASPEFMMQRIG